MRVLRFDSLDFLVLYAPAAQPDERRTKNEEAANPQRCVVETALGKRTTTAFMAAYLLPR
jgi:hypothetical protein